MELEKRIELGVGLKIDKEVTKLKVEGNKEITRIGKEGDVYAGVVNAFSF